MTFIGCDLVVIPWLFSEDAERRQKFVNKTFTRAEQGLSVEPIIPSLLWAAKECAYKVLFKKGTHVAFAPGLFSCVSISEQSDKEGFNYTILVDYKGVKTWVRAGVFDESVRAFGTDCKDVNDRILMKFGCNEGSGDTSYTARRMLNELIESAFNIENECFFQDHPVYKYPVIQSVIAPYLEDVSISHDAENVFVVALKKIN